MIFESINKNKLNNYQRKIIYDDLSEMESFSEKGNKKTSILTQEILIELINKNSILNFQNNNKVIIRYEGFNYIDKLTLSIKDIIKRTKTMPAQYDYDSKLVSIKKELLDNKKDRFKNITDKNFFLNFVLLHEFGHAIHCALAENNHTVKLDSDLVQFATIDQTQYPKYISLLSAIVVENFADIYAVCGIIILDKDNPKMMDNLKEILADRVKYENIDNYYSFNAIKHILENKDVVENFKSLSDLVSLIEEMIKAELKIHIEKELNANKGEVHILNALGYLSSIFIPNAKNDRAINEHLKNKLGIYIPNYSYDSICFFEYRKTQNMNCAEKLKKKIFSMRKDESLTVSEKIKANL